MQVIWKIINNQFCSYKVKLETNTFCRNDYSVTGLCNRQSCPLANSRYATVKEHAGQLYLYMKTIERAHTPAKLWERVKLSKNYAQALEQIDSELRHWPKFMIHKCKQRATKLTQYVIRTRRLIIKGTNKTIEPINKKIERREARREAKAEAAARLETSIEKELMERLRKGVYANGEGMVNLNQSVFERALDKIEDEMEENAGSVDEELDDDEDGDGEFEFEEEEEEEDIAAVRNGCGCFLVLIGGNLLQFEREFVSDASDDESDDDIEDAGRGLKPAAQKKALGRKRRARDDSDEDDDAAGKSSKKGGAAKMRARVNIEYEEELETNKLT
ncbi:hypothetical protein HDU84_003504 [Entophlyctis sp. JEL0112]|nr:hypothetical protein HDU84_003504 [Entophlyctis sp. JEL0112]